MVENPPVNAGDIREADWIPVLGRSPGEGNSNPLQYSFFFFLTPVLLTGEYHGQRSRVGYSPWDPKELNTTEVT